MNREEIRNITSKKKYDIDDLKAIFAYLRSENGCPWDRVQTHESIRVNLIEETYEVVEALDKKDSHLLREELGDLLLQVLFHSAMEEEEGRFSFNDVVSDIAAKLVNRHPHVFGDVSADDPEGALDAWEKAKVVEKKDRKTVKDKMAAVPPQLPSLIRAKKVYSKAIKGGYDIDNHLSAAKSALLKLSCACGEATDKAEYESLISDALTGISALSAVMDIDSEELLSRKTAEFIEKYPEN